MHTNYDKKGFLIYNLSITAHIQKQLLQRYVQDALVGGKMLLDTRMATATMADTRSRILRRIRAAYDKVCEWRAEEEAIKLVQMQLKLTKPDATMADASSKYFVDLELAKTNKRNAALEKAAAKREAAAIASSPAHADTDAPAAVNMPDDFTLNDYQYFTDGNICVGVSESGGTPNATQLTITSADSTETTANITINGAAALINIKSLAILRATCFVAAFTLPRTAHSKCFMTLINPRTGAIELPEVPKLYDSIIKISNTKFLCLHFDGTNTEVSIYERNIAGKIVGIASRTMPFQIKDVKAWPAPAGGAPNTLLITKDAEESYFWEFMSAPVKGVGGVSGSPAKANGGAGAPPKSFAEDMREALPETNESDEEDEGEEDDEGEEEGEEF